VVLKNNETGEVEVAGTISLQDLSAMLQTDFPEEVRRTVTTLNGFLTWLKGDFPRKKEKIHWEKFIFRVKEVDGHRAEKVVIKKRD